MSYSLSGALPNFSDQDHFRRDLEQKLLRRCRRRKFLYFQKYLRNSHRYYYLTISGNDHFLVTIVSDIGNFNGSAIRFNFPSILPRPAPAEHLKTFDEDRKPKYFLFILDSFYTPFQNLWEVEPAEYEKISSRRLSPNHDCVKQGIPKKWLTECCWNPKIIAKIECCGA